MITIIISFALILALVIYLNAVYPAHELRRKLAEDRAAHQKKLDAEFDAVMNEIIYVGAKRSYTRGEVSQYSDIISAYELGAPLEVYDDRTREWVPLSKLTPLVLGYGLVYRRAGKIN